MKHLPLALLLLAGAVLGWIALSAPDPDEGPGVVLGGEDAPVPTALSGDVPTGFVAVALEVDEMCGACCPPSVRDALAHVEGVREVAVDVEAGAAQAVVSTAVDPAALVDALAKHDFPARVVAAPLP